MGRSILPDRRNVWIASGRWFLATESGRPHLKFNETILPGNCGTAQQRFGCCPSATWIRRVERTKVRGFMPPRKFNLAALTLVFLAWPSLAWGQAAQQAPAQMSGSVNGT